MATDFKEGDKSVLVMRLERNQNDLRQLKSKLNSYICEPRTQSLYERIESLRTGLETLSDSNRQIIGALKSRKKSLESYVERAREQLSQFQVLQQGVEEYVANARNC